MATHACLCFALTLVAAEPPGQIDWQRARQLHQRANAGERLSAEDQAYLERARQLRAQGGGAGAGVESRQRKPPASLKPLCDMTADDHYESEDGGLYGGGRNTPPEALAQAAREALAKVRPLDRTGKPEPAGRVVLVSISMSNATQEFSRFKQLADRDPRKSPLVTIVDCAQGGQAMAEWAPAEAAPWREAMRRIAQAGVTPEQVQVAWVKLANKGPQGSLAAHLAKLEEDTVRVLQNARAKFPNLRIVYLGSRIWAGNARGGLNPEPYAYESAFAVRHLIRRQMDGAPELAAGKAPLLLWGPYLWAEGERGRKLDSLNWLPGDFAADGVHPGDSGREKVARLLLEHFANDPLAAGWFTKR